MQEVEVLCNACGNLFAESVFPRNPRNGKLYKNCRDCTLLKLRGGVIKKDADDRCFELAMQKRRKKETHKEYVKNLPDEKKIEIALRGQLSRVICKKNYKKYTRITIEDAERHFGCS